VVDRPIEVLDYYITHRHERLQQVRDALAAGASIDDIDSVVEIVYADVDRSLWPYATLSLRAQLDYLREAGS